MITVFVSYVPLSVSTEYPVLAGRACGHALVVNSKAIEILGITGDTPQVPGGEIVMENGQPNGVFKDNAMDMVYDAIAAPTREDLKDMLRLASRKLNRCTLSYCSIISMDMSRASINR